MPRQDLAVSVLHQRGGVPDVASGHGEKPRDEPRGLRQQRTQALASAFSANPYERRGRQPKVGRREVERLLNPSAGIVEERQQDIVPLPRGGVAIDLSQEVGQLVVAEIAEDGPWRFLHGDCQHALTQTRQRRFGVGHIAKETVDGGQADVAGANAVVTRDFEMREKPQDQLGGQVPILFG